MKDFIKEILEENFNDKFQYIYDNSPLIEYLDSKMGAIYGNAKSRRSLANIYAIYSILYFYVKEYYERPDEYKKFLGYDYTKLFNFYRGLYGGEKLQNHALNSRVNGEFANKFKNETKELIVINDGRYALHISYLYVGNIDISEVAVKIIEKYIHLLQEKDSQLVRDIKELIKLDNYDAKKKKIDSFMNEQSEARMFEIISYAILKNHYKKTKIYIGYNLENLKQEYLTLYKTGRTNANDGGIDFVMRPLGRFFQVTEVNNYNKYLLDIDKVLHFPITFVVKTLKSKEKIKQEIDEFIEQKSGDMEMIKNKYKKAIEEIITINELKLWLYELDDCEIDVLLRDIDYYYRMELNLL